MRLRLLSVGLLAVTLALPGSLEAQAGSDSSYPDRVTATASALLKVGKIADETRMVSSEN